MIPSHIHWLGHSSFRIEDGPTQIYIDPWKVADHSLGADVIFITHAHSDHFSPESIAKIQQPNTVFFATADVAAHLSGDVVVVVPGKTYHAGKLTVQTIPAYNSDKIFHPKEKGWVGYCITLSNGETIYHAGDTDFIPEMSAVQAEIALLPCGGTYTMTAKQAAEAANSFCPKIVIPIHWGSIVGNHDDAKEVQTLFSGTTIILAPE